MNMNVIGIFVFFLLHAMLNEAWSWERHPMQQQWTVEEAQTDLVMRYRYASEKHQVSAVNRFYGQLPRLSSVGYVFEMKNALIGMGIDSHRVQLAHVKHLPTRDDLLVVLVFPEFGIGDPVVLDGLSPRVRTMNDRRDLFLVVTLDDRDAMRFIEQ